MKDDMSDFGFSLVSEEELREQEALLRRKVEEQSKIVQQTSTEHKDKINGIKNMIMPLLMNLLKDPDKHYIFWPNRTEKIKEFIQKLDSYIKND